MTVTLTVTVEAELLAALEEAAQAHDCTIEDVVREVLRQALRPTMQLDLTTLGEGILAALEQVQDDPEPEPVYVTDGMLADMQAFLLPEDRTRLVLGDALWTQLVGVPGNDHSTDVVSARQAAVTEVCERLRGTHTNEGVRRWWTRPRSRLDGQAPHSLLEPGWMPADTAFQRVRALAEADAGFTAT